MTREQGSWAHPSLRAVVEGVGSCTKQYPCTRSPEGEHWWCHNCIANKGLREVNAVIVRLAQHSSCSCDECLEIKNRVEYGEAEARKWDAMLNPKSEKQT